MLMPLTVAFGAEYTAEGNTVAREVTHTVSPGLTYKQSVEVCDGVRQEIFTFEYTPQGDTAIIPAYGSYLYGFTSVGDMIKQYTGEGRVVGGINTDFFITSTGVPLSCLVSGNEIISSCDSRAAIGFDKDGNAVIGFPEIRCGMYSESDNYEVKIAHINKTPARWGVYLVTDKFSATTKSPKSTVEIVLMPYDEDETLRKLFNTSMATPPIESDEAPTLPNDDTSEDESDYDKLPEEEDIIIPEGANLRDFDLSEDMFVPTDSRILYGQEIKVAVADIRRSTSNGKIPNGCFVACVPESRFEEFFPLIEKGDTFTISTTLSEEFSECVSIFGAGSVIVSRGEFVEQADDSIYRYKNPRTAAGIREDGSVIFLCVDGRNSPLSSGYTIKELADYMINAGCVSAVNFDGGGSTTFYCADLGEENALIKNTPSDGSQRRVSDGLIFVNTADKSGIPTYASIYPASYLSYYKSSETVLGDKILFADDTYHPVELEDEYELFADDTYGELNGNVFTSNGTVGEALIGLSSEGLDNDIAIGRIILTDKVDTFSVTAEEYNLDPFTDTSKLSLVASLNTIPVSIGILSPEWTVKIKNDIHHTPEDVEAETDTETPTETVAEKITEESDISEESIPEEEAKDANESEESEESDDHTDITAEESEEEVIPPEFIEVDEAYAFISAEENSFKVIKKGYTYYITATLDEIEITFEITSEKHPFGDTEAHWSARTTYDMFKKGLFIGEESNGEFLFHPERNMTIAEFCTVLARILELDTSFYPKSVQEEATEEEPIAPDSDLEIVSESETTEITTESENFSEEHPSETDAFPEEIITETEDDIIPDESDSSDEPLAKAQQILSTVPEWARGSIFALYDNGYIDSLILVDGEGNPSLDSTRNIMRLDVIRVLGSMMLPDGEISPDYTEALFSDFTSESESDALHLYAMTQNGIITGYEDGTVRPDNSLTRAEAATVFSRFCEFLDKLSEISE